MSKCFMLLYWLICFVLFPSYYVCDIVLLCRLFLLTVLIRVKEFY